MEDRQCLSADSSCGHSDWRTRFAFWSYRREEVSRYKSLLVGLRFSGLVILLLVLLQPAVYFHHEEEESRVFAVIDRSQSMKIKDDGETSRWEKAKTSLLEPKEGLLERLSERHEVEILTVGREVVSSSAKGSRQRVSGS